MHRTTDSLEEHVERDWIAMLLSYAGADNIRRCSNQRSIACKKQKKGGWGLEVERIKVQNSAQIHLRSFFEQTEESV